MDKLIFESVEDISVFMTVAKHGSFSSAALVLGIAGSAVSKRVSRLEGRLGSQLLRRSTRRLSLTEAGELMYTRALAAQESLSEAMSLASDQSVRPSGLLRVASSVSFGLHRVVPHLAEFRRLYPDVGIELAMLDRIVDLVEDGIDVAVRLSSALPDSSVAVKICPVQYLLCSSPGLLRAHPIRKPEDLIGLPWLHYGPRSVKATWTLERKGQCAKVSNRVDCGVNNSDAVALLAVAGQGIALVADFACEKYLESGDLVHVLPDWSAHGPFGDWASLVWRPQGTLPRKTRVFVDFMKQKLAA